MKKHYGSVEEGITACGKSGSYYLYNSTKIKIEVTCSPCKREIMPQQKRKVRTVYKPPLVQVGDVLTFNSTIDWGYNSGFVESDLDNGHHLVDYVLDKTRLTANENGMFGATVKETWTEENGAKGEISREVNLDAHHGPLIGEWLVIDAKMGGGTAPDARDAWPDGWQVKIKQLEPDGMHSYRYTETGPVASFVQDMHTFIHNIESRHINIIRKMARTWY